MPTFTAVWDNALYGCPEQRDYSWLQRSLQNERFPIEGPTRFRRIREEGFIELSIQVPQTPTQYTAFRDFYFSTLNGGEEWFQMPLLLGLLSEPLIVHIRNGFEQSRNTNVFGYYNVNFDLEAVRRVSTVYVPPIDTLIDATTPSNPDLGTLDIIDATSPDNPALGTLDVIDPNFVAGLPEVT